MPLPLESTINTFSLCPSIWFLKAFLETKSFSVIPQTSSRVVFLEVLFLEKILTNFHMFPWILRHIQLLPAEITFIRNISEKNMNYYIFIKLLWFTFYCPYWEVGEESGVCVMSEAQLVHELKIWHSYDVFRTKLRCA